MAQIDAESAPSNAIHGAQARRAARNAAAIAGARVISSGALFAWQLILGRLLGDQAFGVYGTISGLIGIAAPLAAFGISPILIREAARRPELAGRCLAAALFMQTLFALAAYLALNGAAAALSYSAVIQGFAAVAAVSLFIDLPGSLAFDLLLAREKMVTASLVEIVHVLVRVGLGALALAAGFGLLGVYAVTLLAGAGRSLLLWALARRAGIRPQFPLDRGLARRLLRDASPLALAAVLNMSYAYVDRLLTASILGEADAGHLTAAFVIVYGVIDLLSTTILTALYPLMSRAYTQGGENALFRLVVDKLAFFTLMIGVPIVAIFFFYADAVTLPLFGAAFAPSAQILRVLIAYAAAAMFANVYAQALIVQNHQRVTVSWRAIGFAVKLALSAALLPIIGVIGAAFASLTAEIVVLAALARSFSGGGALRWARACKLAAAGLAAGAVMAALASLPLLGMAAGGIAYLGAVLALRILQPDDWDLLYRLAAALLGGALVRRVWRRGTAITW
jgi:O-antigen/teichoic acid export membrane protein